MQPSVAATLFVKAHSRGGLYNKSRVAACCQSQRALHGYAMAW